MKNLDWANLGFRYRKTDYNVRVYYRDGKWGALEISSSEYINLHMAATALHYGQEGFEGLKAYRGKDGKIRLFRWKDNAARLRSTARKAYMAEVPDEVFFDAIVKVLELNKDYIPPYESGASFYIRPFLIGSGAEVGVKPAKEYLFMVFGIPVGPYFPEGFKPVRMLLVRDVDRASPLGMGDVKVGGNYAAGLRGTERAHQKGYASVLFLDCKEKKYIDEAGPANFFGIKNNTYITPNSPSILPSITNKSLITLAEDMGLKVERRPIPLDELETFEEVGACGTAAVITPIGEIVDDETGKTWVFSKDGNPGEISTKLYNRLRAIQYGDEEDKFGWVTVLDI